MRILSKIENFLSTPIKRNFFFPTQGYAMRNNKVFVSLYKTLIILIAKPCVGKKKVVLIRVDRIFSKRGHFKKHVRDLSRVDRANNAPSHG